MMSHGRLFVALATCTVFAACGGGGGTSTPATHPVIATSATRDATLKLTILPSKVIHGVRKSSSKTRKPQFVDPEYTNTVSLQFNPYNFNNNGMPSAPQTNAGPIPIPTYGPTTVNVAVYSGYGNAYGVEVANGPSGGGATAVLASSQQFYTSYTIDPGTTEAISLTLSLVPAYILLTTDPTLATPAYDANGACLNVGNQTQTMLFTLVPADANYNYPQTIAGSPLMPPPMSGISGTVTLSGIMGSSDNGGSSTIVATGATWNGYTVYEFIYTPIGNGDAYAPSVMATATTFNPDGGYDGLDNIGDPPGNNGNTFTEQLTIAPSNCDD